MKKFQAKLDKITQLTSDVFHYDFSYVGDKIPFIPGQFFMLDVEDGQKPPLKRSYSVASAPEDSGFALCIKLVEGGRGSEYLKIAKEGDVLNFSGAFGHFVLKDSPKDVVLISTGTGIAPFLGMIPQVLENDSEKKVYLFFGTSYESGLLYQKELDQWQKKHKNFSSISTVSRPSESWEGANGRVQEHILKSDLDFANSKFYICGIGDMVVDVRKLLIEQGVAKEDIHLEQYTPATQLLGIGA